MKILIFGFLFVLDSFQRIDVNKGKSIEICYPFPEEWGLEYARTIVLARFLIYYAIPLFIIGLFYALIARHLFYSTRNIPGETQGTARQVSHFYFYLLSICLNGFLPQEFE